MSESTELTAEEVCAALNSYDEGKGWQGCRWKSYPSYYGRAVCGVLPDGSNYDLKMDDARAIIAGWRAAEQLIEASNYSLCVYCGTKTRKAEPWSAELVTEIIGEHLENCPTHPMNRLAAVTSDLMVMHSDFSAATGLLQEEREKNLRLIGRIEEKEQDLAAIAAGIASEFDGEISGDVLEQFGQLIEHHRQKEVALTTLRAEYNGLNVELQKERYHNDRLVDILEGRRTASAIRNQD